MPKIPIPKPKPKPKAKNVTGSEAVNARKRYQREAARQLKMAEQTTGETSYRHRAAAAKMLDNAIGTYSAKSKPKYTKEIQSLSERLNVDLDVVNMRRSQLTDKEREIKERRRSRFVEESEVFGIGKDGKTVSEKKRSEAVARMIVTDSSITSRIIGGLEDLWRDEATKADGKVDKRKIISTIKKKLHVRSFSKLLDKLEKITGADLYNLSESEDIYESVKIALQNWVLDEVVA